MMQDKTETDVARMAKERLMEERRERKLQAEMRVPVQVIAGHKRQRVVIEEVD